MSLSGFVYQYIEVINMYYVYEIDKTHVTNSHVAMLNGNKILLEESQYFYSTYLKNKKIGRVIWCESPMIQLVQNFICIAWGLCFCLFVCFYFGFQLVRYVFSFVFNWVLKCAQDMFTWCLNKMTDIAQTTYSHTFPWNLFEHCDKNCGLVGSINSDNDFGRNKWRCYSSLTVWMHHLVSLIKTKLAD